MKFFDYFSGIGGFRLGLEWAGHECVGHCEINKHADKSYRAMHDVKESEFYASNIRDVQPWHVPEAEIYCGGFPCQTFSLAGKRRGLEDIRGTLVFELLRLASVNKPRLLFLENVAGLLNHDEGRTFGTIISALDEVGYDAEWQLVNGKDYVPQSRPRVFIVGHLRGAGGREILPIFREGSTADMSTEPQGLIPGLKEKPTIAIKEATKKGYVVANVGDSINFAFAKSKERRGRVGRGIANTLDTNCEQGVFDGERLRRFTPRECFRIQGFPDEYFDRAKAVNSDSQLYKQAGNAVPPPVVCAIGKRLEI